MSDWLRKTERTLVEQGYHPIDSEETERGYQNKVIRVECESQDLAVKWFIEDENTKTPSIGHSSNRFIGGWYIQTRLDEMLEIPVPNIREANFSDDAYYYIMDNIDFVYADDLWANDMYLMRIGQEIGSILSQIHSVEEGSLGGIPGKKNDTMVNMRQYIKEIENTISETPYMAYKGELESLEKRYERIFNPQSSRRLVHGDTVAGNILTNKEGMIVGLVDWEDSMYADPLLDIAMYQAMVCDIFGVFSPWDIDTLRESVVESYSQAVNNERLEILRALIHLWAGARINSEAMLSPWNRVANKSELTRQEIHRKRFESILNRIDLQ